MYLGRPEITGRIRRALEIDRYRAVLTGSMVKACFARRYDEAIAQLKNTLELDTIIGRRITPRHHLEMKGDYARVSRKGLKLTS